MTKLNLTYRVALSGKLFMAAVVQNGNVLDNILGTGATRQEAEAKAHDLFVEREFDRRSDSKLKGLKWVHVAGQKALRVQPEEVATYVANGYSEGRGHAPKPVEAPTVN